MSLYGAAENLLLGRRYRVKRLLGSGAFGEVFLATQEILGTQDQPGFEFRQVALKLFVNKYVTHGNAAEAFKEAAMLEKIHSRARALGETPHVVSVYEIGIFDDYMYTPFVAMELIGGGCLKDHLRLSLDLPRAVELMRQICAGVRLAHDSGIFHFDLKPENVLMGENGFLKVSDFGVALDKHAAFCLSGFPGTISYSPPESGFGLRETGASDVYSLGLILLELVLKENPLAEVISNAQHLGQDYKSQLLAAQECLSQLVDPKTGLPLGDFALRRDTTMIGILKRCLAMTASERFASAGSLDDALDAWQKRDPLLPPDPRRLEEILAVAAEFRKRGNLVSAERELGEAERICEPPSRELLLEKSNFFEAREQLHEAIDALEAAMRSMRTEPDLRRLAELYRRRGNSGDIRISRSLREEADLSAKRIR